MSDSTSAYRSYVEQLQSSGDMAESLRSLAEETLMEKREHIERYGRMGAELLEGIMGLKATKNLYGKWKDYFKKKNNGGQDDEGEDTAEEPAPQPVQEPLQSGEPASNPDSTLNNDTSDNPWDWDTTRTEPISEAEPVGEDVSPAQNIFDEAPFPDADPETAGEEFYPGDTYDMYDLVRMKQEHAQSIKEAQESTERMRQADADAVGEDTDAAVDFSYTAPIQPKSYMDSLKQYDPARSGGDSTLARATEGDTDNPADAPLMDETDDAIDLDDWFGMDLSNVRLVGLDAPRPTPRWLRQETQEETETETAEPTEPTRAVIEDEEPAPTEETGGTPMAEADAPDVAELGEDVLPAVAGDEGGLGESLSGTSGELATTGEVAGGEEVASIMDLIPGLDVIGVLAGIGLGIYSAVKEHGVHAPKTPATAGVSEGVENTPTTSEV